MDFFERKYQQMDSISQQYTNKIAFEKAFGEAIDYCYLHRSHSDDRLEAIFFKVLKNKYIDAKKKKDNTITYRTTNEITVNSESSVLLDSLSNISNIEMAFAVITNPIMYCLKCRIINRNSIKKHLSRSKMKTISAFSINLNAKTSREILSVYSIIKNRRPNYGHVKKNKGFLAGDYHSELEQELNKKSPNLRIEKLRKNQIAKEIYHDYSRVFLEKRIRWVNNLRKDIAPFIDTLQVYFSIFIENITRESISPSDVDVPTVALLIFDIITIVLVNFINEIADILEQIFTKISTEKTICV